jgi:glycosyltransferase involved in cell wall biosynthesis
VIARLRPYAIIAGDFVRSGGMDAPNFALASYLARTGRAVHVVAYRVADELRRLPDVVVHRVPKPLKAYSLGAPLLASAGLLRAATVARRGGHVVVNGGNCPFPAINWVHYVHGAFAPITRRGMGLRSARAAALHRTSLFTEHLALRVAKFVIANSHRTRRDVIEHVGVPEHRVRTVYYGVDASSFRPASDDERAGAREALGWSGEHPRVAFVGALGDRRKGFDVVYDAWRMLAAMPSWDADLVVVGAGAELSAWRERTALDGLARRISFLGFRNDVPRILAACDALVAPTRYEAYGAGVHEALCCALPSLVTSTAGVAERYPGELRSLLLQDPESADDVAAALWRWRQKASDWRTKMFEWSPELRAWSWDDMAREIDSICEAVS